MTENMTQVNEVINLATCPAAILALDANATSLWPVLIRKVGVTVLKGQHIEDRRAWLLRNFGVGDLTNRLTVQQKKENGGAQDDLARARIWWHIAEASTPGDSISDLTSQNAYLLNAFIVSRGKRYVSPLDVLNAQRSALHSTASLPPCANEKCSHGPDGTRARVPSSRAKFCSRSCRNVVSRRDGFVNPVRTAKTTLQKAA